MPGIDIFTVPTATFRLLIVFVVLSHDRRRIAHFNVTAHPPATWTARQLREAWPFENAPACLLRDRDALYGDAFRTTVRAMGTEDMPTAPHSPWQSPFVQRVIGSIRRECLNGVIIWNERGLRRHLQRYFAYDHTWRPHLALEKDAPIPRPTQPPSAGRIVQIPDVGGLHRHRERRAA